MKRMNCYFLLLAASLCVLPLHAQKEYPIDRITAINLGDGRILHREISGDKPLDGEHRIIDGYHSAYILARFKDGLYNGDYEEYIYNKLKAKGSYKEGWKDGTFRKYDDEGRVTEEKSYKSGKLDGAHRTFYTNGKLEMERFYKAGKQDGKDVYYEFDGTLRREILNHLSANPSSKASGENICLYLSGSTMAFSLLSSYSYLSRGTTLIWCAEGYV